MLIGGAGAAIWIGTYILSWIIIGVWCWVDESKAPERNPIIEFLCTKIFSYRTYDGAWMYKKGHEKSDGESPFFTVVGVLFGVPITLVFLYKIYIVVLAILLVIGLAYLFRYARRNHKAFDKHVKSLDAHHGLSEKDQKPVE